MAVERMQPEVRPLQVLVGDRNTTSVVEVVPAVVCGVALAPTERVLERVEVRHLDVVVTIFLTA